MKFNDPPHERKSDTRPFIARIQFIEQAENPFAIFRCDAYAIIFDVEKKFAILLATLTYLDARFYLIA